jgi:hypothetical protein
MVQVGEGRDRINVIATYHPHLSIFSRACVPVHIVTEDVVERSSLRRAGIAGNKKENGNGPEHEAVRRNEWGMLRNIAWQ